MNLGTSSLSGFCTGACFPRIASATWANEVPLGTVANRAVPMACVDQTWTRDVPLAGSGAPR